MERIFDIVPLHETLIGFESVLHITVENTDVEEQIRQAKSTIANQFQLDLSGKGVMEAKLFNPSTAMKVEGFLASIGESMKRIALLLTYNVATGKYGVTLREVGYLGFDKKSLANCLKYLIHEQLYGERKNFLPGLIMATSKLEVDQMRRLLVVMFVLEELGLFDGVSVIAQFLYMGVNAS